jgi:hypothetical protein
MTGIPCKLHTIDLHTVDLHTIDLHTALANYTHRFTRSPCNSHTVDVHTMDLHTSLAIYTQYIYTTDLHTVDLHTVDVHTTDLHTVDLHTDTCSLLHSRSKCARSVPNVPEPYIYTVHDRIFGDFPAKKYRIYTVYIWFWPTLFIYICV